MSQYITKKRFLLGAFLLLGMAVNIFASGGILDPTFNGNGKSIFNIESAPVSANFAEVAVIAGNKFLVVGAAGVASSYNAVTLGRFNSDGSLDTSFGAGGKVITDTGISTRGVALVVQPDGKIVVAGSAGNAPNFSTFVLRYSADGMLDSTFGNNGILFIPVEQPEDIALTADNKILVAGTAYINNPNQGAQIARINTNGTLDTAFGSNGIVTASRSGFYLPRTDKLAIQPDGKIVLSASASPTVSRGQVYRFNADGSIDSTFGTNGFREILGSQAIYLGGLGIQADGKIVVGGFSSVPQTSDTQIMLTRLNPDGSTDGSLSGGMVFHNLTSEYERVFDMLIQSDGKILLAGHKNAGQAIVARFDSSGALDTTYGSGGVASVTGASTVGAIALQGANLVAIGDFFSAFVARLDQAGTIITPVRYESFVTGKNDQARDVAIQPDGKIVAAGISSGGGGQTIASVARVLPNGSLDPSFGTNGRATVSDGTVYSDASAVAIQPDGKIVVAGRGTQQSTFTYYSLFVARFNADGSLDSTFGTGGKVVVTSPANLIGKDVKLQPDGKIVVAGRVERLVGDGIFEYDMMAARFTTNGSMDALFITYNNNVFDDGRALSIQPNGKILLAGTHLLRLNPDLSIDATFSSTPVPLTFTATDVKDQPDLKIIVSGANGSDFALVRYNPNASIDTGFGINGFAALDFGGADGANAIYLDPNGDIVAGGVTLGGSPNRKRFALARFKPNGSPDGTFGTGGKIITDLGGDASIFGVARQSDGKIVAAGDAKVSIDFDFAIARYLSRTTPFDFDGDGKTDISIFRPSGGEWWYLKSSNGGNYAAHFGASSDKMTPGDFTGDGKTDIAFFRPGSGSWFILRSEDASYYSYPYGLSGDIPVVGDFDADGKADSAVFRPSSSTWFIRRSSDGGSTIQQFGQAGDVPVAADYDADGRTDVAIFRPSSGQWWIQRSTAGIIAFQFGNSSDKPVQGDYTGDGKADVAIWRPATGEWFVLRSEDQSYFSFPFGLSTDIPAPGDYDGDGKFDGTVFRPSTNTWYSKRSSAGIVIQSFGQSGDLPVPGAFVP